MHELFGRHFPNKRRCVELHGLLGWNFSRFKRYIGLDKLFKLLGWLLSVNIGGIKLHGLSRWVILQ